MRLNIFSLHQSNLDLFHNNKINAKQPKKYYVCPYLTLSPFNSSFFRGFTEKIRVFSVIEQFEPLLLPPFVILADSERVNDIDSIRVEFKLEKNTLKFE